MMSSTLHHIRALFCPTRIRFWLAIGLLAGSTILVSDDTKACEADSILNLFEASLPADQVTKVSYRKEARSLLFGDRPAETGTLWLGPPKRYRIEAGKQVIVRGTDTLWSYTPEAKQVTLRVGGLDSLEFGPAGFFGSLRNDFFPVDCADDTLDANPYWRVRLAAKTETAAIQRLTLWITPTTHRVQIAEYVDYNEESARLTFSDYQVEKPGGSDRFVFNYPSGVERIVLPAVKSGQAHDDGE
jgi:outer membrane lipoprotein-sorting protein